MLELLFRETWEARKVPFRKSYKREQHLIKNLVLSGNDRTKLQQSTLWKMKVHLCLTTIFVLAIFAQSHAKEVTRRLGKKKERLLGKKQKKGSKKGESSQTKTCFRLRKLGVINLDFNAAFLSFQEFDSGGSALTITSFFNVKVDKPPMPTILAPDLVARLFIDQDESFDSERIGGVEILTDQDPNAPPGPPKTVWPNENVIAPDGVFPFEAMVVAQGFLSAPFPGRLSAIDTADGTEYIISQSVGLGAESRFYHNSVFHDMDGDGLLDIISVRSGRRAFPGPPPPVAGELVWFKNPGENIDKGVEWDENVIVSGLGPDIEIVKYDFDGDGVPEFLTTHFFTGKKITIYGVLGEGNDWKSVVDGNAGVRYVDVSTGQGSPFGVKIKDLDGDGNVDILATNHQGDNCNFPEDIPGKVYAISPPSDKGMFFNESHWTTRILLDDIYPNPSMPGARGSRLAPGKALTFYPSHKAERAGGRPWIVVGGDEASKVWVFRPKGKKGWSYDMNVIFDINDYYGENATQTNLAERPGVSISTIGSVAVRYDREGKDGMAEIYIPVFEGQDVHVFGFRQTSGDETYTFPCPKGSKLECSAP